MQNKKKVKEKNFGEALEAIGREMGKRFTTCIAYELGDKDPYPVRITLKYRPGHKHEWFSDPAVSFSVEGDNMTVSENLTGYDTYSDEKDRDDEDEE